MMKLKLIFTGVCIAGCAGAFETDDAYNREIRANQAFVKADQTRDYKLSEADGESWTTYGNLDLDGDGVVTIQEFLAGADLPDPVWNGKVLRNVVYKRAGTETCLMDIYEPRCPGEGKAPVFYYIHGGGWSGGSKEISGDIQRVMEQLSDRGFVCVSVMYRLVKAWNPDDPVLMRDCAVDCRDGLRFLKQHEEELNMDMDRVVAFGASAGGHLAQLMTYSGANEFSGDSALRGHAVEVAAGISWFGPSDFRKECLFEWEGPGNKFSVGHWARFIAKTDRFDYDSEDPRLQQMAEEVSPVWWLKKDSAPLLHIHGDQDSVIPPHHAAHLKEHAEACGADVTVQIVQGAGHGWWAPGIEPDQKAIVQMTVDFAEEQVRRSK